MLLYCVFASSLIKFFASTTENPKDKLNLFVHHLKYSKNYHLQWDAIEIRQWAMNSDNVQIVCLNPSNLFILKKFPWLFGLYPLKHCVFKVMDKLTDHNIKDKLVLAIHYIDYSVPYIMTKLEDKLSKEYFVNTFLIEFMSSYIANLDNVTIKKLGTAFKLLFKEFFKKIDMQLTMQMLEHQQLFIVDNIQYRISFIDFLSRYRLK